jgi:NAD(P)-dependent dehydrogenase (short-subunit alcohol dehydrogenase family)
MLDMSGHAALVTGSTAGVGRSIVEALASSGADVVIHGRAPSEHSEATLASCRDKGVRASFVAADLCGPVEETVRQIFDAALEAQPDLDILVNNAGQYFDVPFSDMTYERFDKTMRLNVAAPYFLTQAFARSWSKNRRSGRVLFVGSINGRLAEVDSTAYDVSKGGLEMMVKTLCVALAPHGIRVNGLAPGLVRTPQTAWIDERPGKARWVAYHTPNGAIPDADVCSAGAVYLVSDAARHVQGQMLLVDGGMSAWQQPRAPQGPENNFRDS